MTGVGNRVFPLWCKRIGSSGLTLKYYFPSYSFLFFLFIYLFFFPISRRGRGHNTLSFSVMSFMTFFKFMQIMTDFTQSEFT